MTHQGVDFCTTRAAGAPVVECCGRYDHGVEAPPRPDELAAPLQSLGGVEESAPADADLLLRFIRRKDSPAPGEQAGSVGG